MRPRRMRPRRDRRPRPRRDGGIRLRVIRVQGAPAGLLRHSAIVGAGYPRACSRLVYQFTNAST